MKNFGKILKRVAIAIILVYATITFVNQQKILNAYDINSEELAIEIANAKEYQEELYKTKENATSLEYIEKIAREKLGMYMPNEKVYVDSEN